jgi:hypothetical protein
MAVVARIRAWVEWCMLTADVEPVCCGYRSIIGTSRRKAKNNGSLNIRELDRKVKEGTICDISCGPKVVWLQERI